MFTHETLLKHLNNTVHIGASTDISGVFGHPQFSTDFWTASLPPNTNLGKELLTWRTLSESHYSDKTVIGMHGRTGDNRKLTDDPYDVLKLYGVNKLIKHSERVISVSAKKDREKVTPQYFLLHEPEAFQLKEYLISQKDSHLVFAIEIHPSRGSLEKCLTLINELRDNGVSCVLVFDIVHYMKGLDQHLSYEQQWKKMLEVLGSVGPCLIHLPVGTDKRDSIWTSLIDNKMIEDYGDVVYSREYFQVLEHQIGGAKASISHRLLRQHEVQQFADRAKRVVNRFIDNGALLRPRVTT